MFSAVHKILVIQQIPEFDPATLLYTEKKNVSEVVKSGNDETQLELAVEDDRRQHLLAVVEDARRL